MRILVLDSSVAAKWYQEEEHFEAARRLLFGSYEFHAPDFFKIEFHNVLCKWMRTGLINEHQGDTIRQGLKLVPITYHPWQNLLDASFHTATLTKRSLYDCLYLTLAIYLNQPMVTADRKLHDAIAAGPLDKFITWLENVPQ